MTLIKSASATALALLLAGPAFSQGAVVGTDALDERIEELEEDTAEELAESDDPNRFGAAQFTPGWSGSVALGYSGTDGNVEEQDLNIAGRLRYGGSVINHSLGYALEFGEVDGDRTEEEAFIVYEANADITDRVYGFGLGSARYDEFDTIESDAFLGAGLGYRLVNTPNFAWRVQAGPGVRYTQDAFDEESTEVAGIGSSRVFYQFTDTVNVTNDTDVLYSDNAGTLVRNDLGVNVGIARNASTRISYRTDYNSDPLPGFESTDNRLGVAVVFGF